MQLVIENWSYSHTTFMEVMFHSEMYSERCSNKKVKIRYVRHMFLFVTDGFVWNLMTSFCFISVTQAADFVWTQDFYRCPAQPEGHRQATGDCWFILHLSNYFSIQMQIWSNPSVKLLWLKLQIHQRKLQSVSKGAAWGTQWLTQVSQKAGRFLYFLGEPDKFLSYKMVHVGLGNTTITSCVVHQLLIVFWKKGKMINGSFYRRRDWSYSWGT